MSAEQRNSQDTTHYMHITHISLAHRAAIFLRALLLVGISLNSTATGQRKRTPPLRAAPADIAPTLATILRVQPPSNATGRVLLEALSDK